MNRYKRIWRTSCFSIYTGLLAFCQSGVFAASVDIRQVEGSGLQSYHIKGKGFELELIQLHADFVRAIYENHNFPREEIERIAGYCFYGSILKNPSERTLHYRVADWQYRTPDGQLHSVKTKTDWVKEWQEKGIRFSWTLLADQGDFFEGDWQQGFTTIKTDRQRPFDLILKWWHGDEPRHIEVKGMRCATE